MEEPAKHKIAQSFAQANRIAKMVIKNGGDNKFMGNGGSISGGVRDAKGWKAPQCS